MNKTTKATRKTEPSAAPARINFRPDAGAARGYLWLKERFQLATPTRIVCYALAKFDPLKEGK
jgi:hypothetical protein